MCEKLSYQIMNTLAVNQALKKSLYKKHLY